jgi:peptide/nickel transport system permease protein
MWELLLKSMKFKIGLLIAVIIVGLGVIGPFFVPNPTTITSARLEPPSAQHLLGTTQFGQDVFAQLCYGIQNSLVIGGVAGGLGTLIAVLVGGIGPYLGGKFDQLFSMITNLIICLPVYALFIIIAAGSRQGLTLLGVGLILGLISWPWAARSIRSQVLTLKEREFINLARMSGQSGPQIVLAEILPNMFAYIMMVFVILTGTAILAESALSMIGIATTKTVTLGYMLYWAQRQTQVPMWWYVWWYFIPPGLVLTILLTSIFVMHAGMDEVFNPRLREI